MRPPSSLRRYARCRPAPHPSNDFPDAAEVYARRILWISARTGSARQEQGFFAQALKPTYVGCSLQQAIRRLVHELPRCGNDFRYLRHHFLVLSAKVVRRQFQQLRDRLLTGRGSRRPPARAAPQQPTAGVRRVRESVRTPIQAFKRSRTRYNALSVRVPSGEWACCTR
jgi:hypothetical protein